MRVQELGEIQGPVLLFGGPYSNLAATRALVAKATEHGVVSGHMISTGDLVAYCAHAAATVALIRDLGCPVVAGNCEKQLAQDLDDCGCGFEQGSTCDLLSAGWYAHARGAIGRADRDWMMGLPDIVTFSHHGARCAVIHGGVTEISRFLWPVSPDAEFTEEIDALERLTGPIDRVFAGHSGLAFQRHIGGIDWVNTGAIGMPPNDGGTRTRYVVMQGGSVGIHHLSYDHQTSIDAMQRAGLTQGYHRALQTGYWPSEDVLPPVLRRAALASG